MKEWRDCLVSPEAPILKAIEIIDQVALQIVLVVDAERRLLGTVTDGDVRRCLLAQKSFDVPVGNIMNRAPITASPETPKEDLHEIMRGRQVFQIPILDREGRIIDLETIDHLKRPKLYQNRVVIMAGGLGSRLRPMTEKVPKPLLNVGDKPLLETILRNFISFGFHRFYFSVNYKANMIKDYFGDGSNFGVQIDYVEETRQLGTAGGLSLLDEPLEDPFFVMNGDLLTKLNFQQLLKFHQRKNAQATMCIREHRSQIPYGVIELEEDRILAVEEKPVQRMFVNAGIYVLEPSVLEEIPAGRYFTMTQLFRKLLEKGKQTAAFPIREYWMDIGQKSDYQKAQGDYFGIFGEQKNER